MSGEGGNGDIGDVGFGFGDSGIDDPSGEERGESRDALLSRLHVIEEQPLESRAEALGHLHDELRARLEAGDAPRR